MAIAQTGTGMDGIPSNSGLLIRAADYATGEGDIIWGTTYNQQGVYTDAVGTQLMETPWFKAGTFNNLVIPTIYMDSDVTGGTLGCILCLTIHKRREGQLGSLDESKKLYVPYKAISDTTGSMPQMQWLNKIATQFLWFDARCEYKFEVHVSKLTSGNYVVLQGIYLQYSNNNAVHYPIQVQGRVDTDDVYTQAVPIIEGFWWTTAITSYSNKTVTFNPATMDGGGTTSGTVDGWFNTVDYVGTSWQSSTNFTYSWTHTSSLGTVTLGWPSIFSSTVDDGAGGLTIQVQLAGFETGTETFHTLVVGTTNAMVV